MRKRSTLVAFVTLLLFAPALAPHRKALRQRALGLVLFALFGAGLAVAQEPAPAPGPAEELLGLWNREAKKLIDMAEDFPEEKYGYKPTPEVRSFAEQLLHVAEANFRFARAARSEPAGPEHLSAETHKTKGEIVAALKQSFAEGAALIQQAGDTGLTQPMKHPFANRMISRYGYWMLPVVNAGEHYGNLVVYYRLNGLVPPTTRAAQARQR